MLKNNYFFIIEPDDEQSFLILQISKQLFIHEPLPPEDVEEAEDYAQERIFPYPEHRDLLQPNAHTPGDKKLTAARFKSVTRFKGGHSEARRPKASRASKRRPVKVIRWNNEKCKS